MWRFLTCPFCPISAKRHLAFTLNSSFWWQVSLPKSLQSSLDGWVLRWGQTWRWWSVWDTRRGLGTQSSLQKTCFSKLTPQNHTTMAPLYSMCLPWTSTELSLNGSRHWPRLCLSPYSIFSALDHVLQFPSASSSPSLILPLKSSHVTQSLLANTHTGKMKYLRSLLSWRQSKGYQ